MASNTENLLSTRLYAPRRVRRRYRKADLAEFGCPIWKPYWKHCCLSRPAECRWHHSQKRALCGSKALLRVLVLAQLRNARASSAYFRRRGARGSNTHTIASTTCKRLASFRDKTSVVVLFCLSACAYRHTSAHMCIQHATRARARLRTRTFIRTLESTCTQPCLHTRSNKCICFSEIGIPPSCRHQRHCEVCDRCMPASVQRDNPSAPQTERESHRAYRTDMGREGKVFLLHSLKLALILNEVVDKLSGSYLAWQWHVSEPHCRLCLKHERTSIWPCGSHSYSHWWLMWNRCAPSCHHHWAVSYARRLSPMTTQAQRAWSSLLRSWRLLRDECAALASTSHRPPHHACNRRWAQLKMKNVDWTMKV